MKLESKISVNTHYTRSVNVERDADNVAVVRSYIPTSRALRTLERIQSSFGSHQAPRAWSLVGPYGSGKSSFSVFLSQLLSNPEESATRAAAAVLKGADEQLKSQFFLHTRKTKGYCSVLITGSPEPLGVRIIKGLTKAAEAAIGADRRKASKQLIETLHQAQTQTHVQASELINLVSRMQDALVANEYKGLIITIDELGKFLEYEARHYGANDIYLLQALAEHACSGHAANLLLFVLLHQSFEQYAKGLGESLKKEWSKVQGRFEEVPFLESAEQVLRIVSAAFNTSLSATEEKTVKAKVKQHVALLSQQNALPAGLPAKEAEGLFFDCYPLHPISAILLPVLCQKIAQNERTLFSYLGSQEPNGFGDLLKSLDVGGFIYPHHIYDYFITNQPAVLGDHFTHRRWVEVITAIDRLGDAEASTIQLLKTIGLLNIIGAKGGLKASAEILDCCSDDTDFSKNIKKLTQRSIITFRKFNGEYRVWQGSDFDLEEALREEIGKLGNFSLSHKLASRKVMLPVVARRYTIENGALRYFQPAFVDAQSYKQADANPSEPTLVFFLAAGQDDEALFRKEVRNHFSDLCIAVLCLNGSQLREATAEVIALQNIEATRQELSNDPIAKRELQDRLTAAEAAEDELLQDLLDYPEAAEWHWSGKRLPVDGKRQLQEQFSRVLSAVYKEAPRIHNELINRDKPSSQAAAARNKLLALLLDSTEKRDLGIEKFPPEKAIYRSVLREMGLHVESKGKWKLSAPTSESSIYAAWCRIDEFLATTEVAPRSFAELTAELIAPPYGIKEGVIPILYIVATLVYQHEIAIYEERIYRPCFTVEMLERFVKRPEEFTFQRFRIQGLRASIFTEYSKALFGSSTKKTVVELIRPLAQFIGDLPDYTQRTRSSDIGEAAKAVRNAFNIAKSPEQLLFEDLPIALGFSNLQQEQESDLTGFAKALQDALRELKYAYPNLLEKQQKLLAQAFHMSETRTLAELRRTVIGRYEGLDQYTIDADGLRAFIKRLTKHDGDDDMWLQNILMFLGQKPAEKWSDADRAEAEIKLSDYSKRLLDLETLRLHYDRNAKHIEGDFDVILLKSLKKGEEPIDEVVAIDRKRHNVIQEFKQEIDKVFSGQQDSELKLAALAEYVDDFLKTYRETKIQSTKSARGRPRKAVNSDD